MTRRDRLVELACLWQEIRADRPPMHRPSGTGRRPVSTYGEPMQASSVGLRPGAGLAAPTTLR
jgi:hypothetical protein